MKIIAKKQPNLDEKIKEYIELYNKKKEIEKQLKGLKDEFLNELFLPEIEDEENKYKFETAEVELSFELVTQNRFDTTTFKEEHPKYYEMYLKPTINKVLKASIKEK